MTDSHPASHHEHFSLPLFAATVVTTLAALGTGLWWLFPEVAIAQMAWPWWKGVAVFAGVSLFNAFLEYFFHRYVLHTPAVRWLGHFYRQHTLHHALTRIRRRRVRPGHDLLVVENKFPIVEPEQTEASFFPWYSLAVFALLITPLLAGLHVLWPTYPWFLGGYMALASSLALYEILHAINHWSLDRWEPLIFHPTWGRFWRPVYGFHLRHHAVIHCNESISGFFGLPIADWVFRTCVIPQTLFVDGEPDAPGEFEPPRPCALIRVLDRWALAAVQRQRSRKSPDAAVTPKETELVFEGARRRPYTRGEEVANWVTHGIGLALSVAALTLLIVVASVRGDAWHVVSFTVFGLTVLLLYGASTLYHAFRNPRWKSIFLRLDHAAIFLLIAGTYTPFLLTSLRGPWGWTFFGIIWGVSTAGVVFKLLFGPRFRAASVATYLVLGWIALVALQPLRDSVPPAGLALLLIGGLVYSLGVPFYLWKRLRFHHAVWHVFVLGGSTCHFLAILLYLAPKTA